MESDDDELTMTNEVKELQAALNSALNENEWLREELEALRLIYPEGTFDKLTFLELKNKQLQAMMNLTTLRDANLIREKEWDPNGAVTLAYRGNELAGEVGEACNIIKKLERERIGIRGTRATKEMLAEELADVVICLDLIAMQAGIDLETAVRLKFNGTSEKYGLATRIS